MGSSTVRKAAWLFLNMFILPIRSLYKVKVEANGFVVLNWVVCFATVAAVAWASFPALLFLALSLFMSQGFHPANARQLQRHYWDGSAGKAVNGQGGAAMTFSYYGWTNALFLNVGYHNEHHDFVQVAWTRLPALRALVGDAYYPDSAAYASRGMADLVNFVTNPQLTLANFYSAEHAPAREDAHRDSVAAALKKTAAAATAVKGAGGRGTAAAAPEPPAEDPPVERVLSAHGSAAGIEEDPASASVSDDERVAQAAAKAAGDKAAAARRAAAADNDDEPAPEPEPEAAARVEPPSPARRRRARVD